MSRKAVFGLAVVSLFVGLWLVINRESAEQSNRVQTPSPPNSVAELSQPSVRGDSQPGVFTWAQLKSDDLKLYVKNLRTVGYPESTVSNILRGEVDLLLQAKGSGLLPQEALPYHVPGINIRAFVKQKLLEEQKAALHEKQVLLTDLLGYDVVLDANSLEVTEDAILASTLDFLPPQDRPQTVQIINEFATRFDAEVKPLLDGRSGPPLKADSSSEALRQSYSQLYQARENRLTEVLGPQGKEDFDLRTSQLAEYLRFRLQGVPMTETEFREIHRLVKSHELLFDVYYSSSEEHKEANGLLAVTAQTVLGADRWAKTSSWSAASKARFGLR